MSYMGSFGRSARTRGWAVLDGLRSKELISHLHGTYESKHIYIYIYIKL